MKKAHAVNKPATGNGVATATKRISIMLSEVSHLPRLAAERYVAFVSLNLAR